MWVCMAKKKKSNFLYAVICINLLSLGTNKASYFILLVELSCEPLLIYPLFALPSRFGCSLAASVCCFNRVRISQIPSQPGWWLRLVSFGRIAKQRLHTTGDCKCRWAWERDWEILTQPRDTTDSDRVIRNNGHRKPPFHLTERQYCYICVEELVRSRFRV